MDENAPTNLVPYENLLCASLENRIISRYLYQINGGGQKLGIAPLPYIYWSSVVGAPPAGERWFNVDLGLLQNL